MRMRPSWLMLSVRVPGGTRSGRSSASTATGKVPEVDSRTPPPSVAPGAHDGGQTGDRAHGHAPAGVAVEAVVHADGGRVGPGVLAGERLDLGGGEARRLRRLLRGPLSGTLAKVVGADSVPLEVVAVLQARRGRRRASSRGRGRRRCREAAPDAGRISPLSASGRDPRSRSGPRVAGPLRRKATGGRWSSRRWPPRPLSAGRGRSPRGRSPSSRPPWPRTRGPRRWRISFDREGSPRVPGRSVGPCFRTRAGPCCRRRSTAGWPAGPPWRPPRGSVRRSRPGLRPRRCARSGPPPWHRRASSGGGSARGCRRARGTGSPWRRGSPA